MPDYTSGPPTTEVACLLAIYYALGGTSSNPGTTEVQILLSILYQIIANGQGGGAATNPGGSPSQLQYNNAGSFGGVSGATSDGTTLTMVAPILGTPASGTLTNCTGLPPAGVVGTAAILGANTFTGKQTITQATANAGIIGSTGYSLTGANASNMLDYAGTWNTSGAPTGLKLRITNTASDAASLLFDFGTSAAALATLRIDGAFRLLKSYSASNYHIGDGSGGLAWASGESYFCKGGGAFAALVSDNGLIMKSSLQIGFTSGNADAGANDTFWTRAAANKFGCSTAADADVVAASTHTVRMFFNGVEYKVLVATP